MINRNINQHGAQTTCLGVMIGRCSLDNKYGELIGIKRMSSSKYTNNSSSRCTNHKQIDRSHQRPQCRKCTGEDNKLAVYCYFRSNPAKRGYRKRMIEIWTEFGRFKATNQRLANQVRKITENGWFSDLEIPEIHQQIYRQTYRQTLNTVIETLNSEKPETPNQKLHDNGPCTTNTQTQTLTQEEKTNIDTIKESCLKRKLHCLLSGTKTGGQSSPKPRKWTTY